MSEPIRGLKAMAIVRWILLALIAAVAVTTWVVTLAPEHTDERAARYYCPMHPQIRSAEPGTCPICFMNLEPIPEHEAPPDDTDETALAPVMLTAERIERAGIATAIATRRTIGGQARWPASIEASEGARAEVRVRADAFVERIAIRETDVSVRAGQPLAWVYSPEIVRAEEELLVAHRWPEHADVEAAGRRRLSSLGMGEREIDAMLASGRSQRTFALRAPIAGYVTRLDAVVGSYATPETLLYEITDLARVRVVATPPEHDVSWLAPDMPARFVPRSGPPIALALDLVEPSVTEGARALRVRFRSESSLRPGDIGEVIIDRPPIEALVVPRDAVIDTGTARYVFVEGEHGLFTPRPVEIGALHGELRVIVSGLEANERVVARGAFVLDSESRLQAALAPEGSR